MFIPYSHDDDLTGVSRYKYLHRCGRRRIPRHASILTSSFVYYHRRCPGARWFFFSPFIWFFFPPPPPPSSSFYRPIIRNVLRTKVCRFTCIVSVAGQRTRAGRIRRAIPRHASTGTRGKTDGVPTTIFSKKKTNFNNNAALVRPGSKKIKKLSTKITPTRM